MKKLLVSAAVALALVTPSIGKADSISYRAIIRDAEVHVTGNTLFSATDFINCRFILDDNYADQAAFIGNNFTNPTFDPPIGIWMDNGVKFSQDYFYWDQ